MTFFPFSDGEVTVRGIDYRCKGRKKKLRVKWCHYKKALIDCLFQKTPTITPQKANRSARRCVWRYRFLTGVWNCQILNQVVESQLCASLWNRYHQRLPEIEPNQMNATFSFLFQDKRLFQGWKADRGLKLLPNSRTPENVYLHICSLWCEEYRSYFSPTQTTKTTLCTCCSIRTVYIGTGWGRIYS
jgi:hypothetical protein